MWLGILKVVKKNPKMYICYQYVMDILYFAWNKKQWGSKYSKLELYYEQYQLCHALQ